MVKALNEKFQAYSKHIDGNLAMIVILLLRSLLNIPFVKIDYFFLMYYIHFIDYYNLIFI